ncbi:30S ribosomal protein S14 [Candidatus Woesearchaeota archaeon CG_4_10_14_0_8_um_filter_47_5]|nr:MAG: 30S ribosomal protein S14 [Candidatus Woesearchaeota archaeon CG_4_10_14_0_8_um_filter_47_5]
MTVSDYRKVFKQLKAKPIKLRKFLKHNKPKERSVGLSNRRCRICLRVGGHVGKYNLQLCRHCFRENATKLGFKQYN